MDNDKAFKLELAVRDDCDLIYEWANDSEVRKNSFNQDAIKYEDHVSWFDRKLKSDNSYIYIFYDDDVPAGETRLDIEEGISGKTALISYLIGPNARGNGYGAIMLREIEVIARGLGIRILNAEVKEDNKASIKVFEKLGYDKKLENQVYSFTKYI